jgi:membrane associated rhomboid family serine protease
VLLLSPAYTFTVGASGAVFGLFGAVLALALWGPISGSSIRPKIHSVYMFSSRCAGLDIECENPLAAAVLLLSPAYTFTVGASGAVFGLFGAVLALALWPVTMPPRWPCQEMPGKNRPKAVLNPISTRIPDRFSR